MVASQVEAIGRMYQSNKVNASTYVYCQPSGERVMRISGRCTRASTQLLSRLGLLRHDRERWISFEEITVFASGHRLLIFTLLHGAVGDPRKLWDDFKDAICDDLPHAIAHFERRTSRICTMTTVASCSPTTWKTTRDSMPRPWGAQTLSVAVWPSSTWTPSPGTVGGIRPRSLRRPPQYRSGSRRGTVSPAK